MSINVPGSERQLYISLNCGGSHSTMLAQLGPAEPIFTQVVDNWKYTDIGIEESVRRSALLINHSIDSSAWDTAGIAIGMSGASNMRLNAEYEARLAGMFGGKSVTVQLNGDSLTSLAAAYGADASGYLIISGTGCSGLARTVAGELVRAGGWGRMLGDQGSGYWIGLQALRHYVSVLDRAASGGLLFERIKKSLDAKFDGDFSKVRTALYSDVLRPSEFAQMVFESIEDRAAEEIIREAAAHLVSLVALLGNKSSDPIAPVLNLHGSVATNPACMTLISAALRDELEIHVLSVRAILEYSLDVARAFSLGTVSPISSTTPSTEG